MDKAHGSILGFAKNRTSLTIQLRWKIVPDGSHIISEVEVESL